MICCCCCLVTNACPTLLQPWFDSWVRKIPCRRDRLPTPVFLGFPCGSAGKESTCNAGDLGSISGLGRCPEEEKGYPLQYSGLENSMKCIVHRVTKSQTWQSDFHFTSLMDCSPPGSSAYGISQARILEGVAISFSRKSSQSRDWTCVSWLAGVFFTTESSGKP